MTAKIISTQNTDYITQPSPLEPFVKWAGGKRQLLPQIKERMPKHYNTYYEPFVGGGAVLFHLHPEHAIINDINPALIHTYKEIRDNTNIFIQTANMYDKELKENGKEYYYAVRDMYNDKLMQQDYDTELASMFVFLNKHCFNGLYRVNGKGLFNVPYNNSDKTSIQENMIYRIAKYLQKVTIVCEDFESACLNAKEGDFVFIDSPYVPLNPTSFDSYTKERFTKEDHLRLAELYDELTKRRCYCMLTNHNTELTYELYGNKGYRMDVVSAKRMINSNASKRTGEEVIIFNYDT